MSEGFLTNTWVAMLFYRVCMRYGIQRQEDRVLLLRKLVKRHHAKYIRDVGAFAAGKKVLVVRNTPHNDGPRQCCSGCRPKEPK
jgi:hypothetical protein